MLECHGLAVAYGRHLALKGVDLKVAAGEIVVMLGANGAGKTTLLKALAGLVPVSPASQVLLEGQPLTGAPPHRIVEAGLALVPEGRGVFADLTVRENLLLGAYAQRARAGQDAQLQRVLSLFPKLGERSAQIVRTMSGGEQQMVAIGRALMSSPAILMLDEPSLGLSPLLCSELFRALKEVRKTGVGILLVEQNARQSLAIADRAYLLENGHLVGEGAADQMMRDPAVQAAYLGGAAAKAAPQATAVAASEAASASVAAAAPWAPSPSPSPSHSPRAEQLIPTRIADLVQMATRVQAEQVDNARRQTAAAPSAPTTGDTLAQAIARIEAAATAARMPSPTAEAATPAPAAQLPTIEVWRRPLIEIWRRGKDGKLQPGD